MYLWKMRAWCAALLGWRADPVAALVMVPIIVKEGIEALGGKTCCDDEKCKLTVSHSHEDIIDVR